MKYYIAKGTEYWAFDKLHDTGYAQVHNPFRDYSVRSLVYDYTDLIGIEPGVTATGVQDGLYWIVFRLPENSRGYKAVLFRLGNVSSHAI